MNDKFSQVQTEAVAYAAVFVCYEILGFSAAAKSLR
jgi:hypothetical protein